MQDPQRPRGTRDGSDIFSVSKTSKVEQLKLDKDTGSSKTIDKKKQTLSSSYTIADVIGQFGFYQLSLSSLAFIRYVCLAMMTNTGPLIAPEVNFTCIVDNATLSNIKMPENQTTREYLTNRCTLNLNNGSQLKCPSMHFDTCRYGTTVTDFFGLACDYDYLKSALQSVISIGVVIASITGGSFSDKQGRVFTARVCFVISLVAGVISYMTTNFAIYALSRALCTFGDLGLVVSLTTIVTETLGNKYRGTACLVIYTGWAIGVMIMPWVVDFFKDYRQLMLFTVACHLTTLPWMLTVKESVRWSLVNGKIDDAHRELKRISWWNMKADKKSLDEVDRKFNILKKKFVKNAQARALLQLEEESKCKSICRMLCGGFSKVGLILKSKELLKTTVTLISVTFTTELFYMLFILINSDVGEDVKTNYAIGGLMEILATVISIVMIARLTRRFSLILTLLSISALCICLAFYHQVPDTSTVVLNAAKLATSTLSSIVFVVTTEVFPTDVRQTGFGLCGTIGSFGAVLAPFVRGELVDLVGLYNVLLAVSVIPLIASLCIPFFLRETMGIELTDDTEELAAEENNLKSSREKSASP